MEIVQYNNGAIKKVSFYMKSEKSWGFKFFQAEVWGVFFIHFGLYCFDFKKQERCFLKGLLIFQAGKLKWQQL